MKRYKITLAAAVCCAALLYWMGSDPLDSKMPAEVAVNVADPGEKQRSRPETSDEGAVVTEQETKVDEQVDQTVLAANFEPPFPNRLSLFQAPKRQGRGRVQSQGQSETAVELLGFVNVDGQRVALSIDGLVTMVAEGDKQYGIEVISIQPPAVVLQRGRQRWQASFEN